jgi:hypothetical protein
MQNIYAIYSFDFTFLEINHEYPIIVGIDYSNHPNVILSRKPKSLATVLVKIKNDFGKKIGRFLEIKIKIARYDLKTRQLIHKREITVPSGLLETLNFG